MQVAPAVGKPMFALLFLIYFVMSYLLIGAAYLILGAQASTQRELQMMSLPMTFVQMGMVGLAGSAAAAPGTTVALIAAIFPFSSPMAMAAQAANSPRLWPHAARDRVAIAVGVGRHHARRALVPARGAQIGQRTEARERPPDRPTIDIRVSIGLIRGRGRVGMATQSTQESIMDMVKNGPTYKYDGPVDPLDVSRAELYRDDIWQAPFKELRAKAPVYKVEGSDFGPYWSVSTYKPIVEAESLPEIFSSEAGGITLADFLPDSDVKMPMFIAMDRPKHTGQRRTVAPAFTPSEMVRMKEDIVRRTAEVLDTLEYGKQFDWVDTVAIELTTQMLAILFDFPWEDRRKLTFWSDWAGDIELVKTPELRAERLTHMYECGAYFGKLWNDKLGKEPTPDLIA